MIRLEKCARRDRALVRLRKIAGRVAALCYTA
jgi:hypothetical protein